MMAGSATVAATMLVVVVHLRPGLESRAARAGARARALSGGGRRSEWVALCLRGAGCSFVGEGPLKKKKKKFLQPNRWREGLIR